MSSDLTLRLKLIAKELPVMIHTTESKLINHYNELRCLWDMGGTVEEKEQRLKDYCQWAISKIGKKQ